MFFVSIAISVISFTVKSSMFLASSLMYVTSILTFIIGSDKKNSISVGSSIKDDLPGVCL